MRGIVRRVNRRLQNTLGAPCLGPSRGRRHRWSSCFSVDEINRRRSTLQGERGSFLVRRRWIASSLGIGPSFPSFIHFLSVESVDERKRRWGWGTVSLGQCRIRLIRHRLWKDCRRRPGMPSFAAPVAYAQLQRAGTLGAPPILVGRGDSRCHPGVSGAPSSSKKTKACRSFYSSVAGTLT